MGVDWLEEAERDLKEVLGSLYSGYNLGYEDGKFVIGLTCDAPACEQVIATGETLTECIENYRKNHP